MAKYFIRFNKTRGMPGRGSMEHVWRVFEGDKEYVVKHVKITVPCWDEVSNQGAAGDDFNICCEANMTLDRDTSTAIFA